MWALLDNQPTLHLFFNPDHPWISNAKSGPGVLNIHCNSGISKTNTIADVSFLDVNTAWIHLSGLTNVLSFAMIEQCFSITYDNHGSGSNGFIVHISPFHNIRFRQSKRRTCYYDPTDDTSCHVTVMINTALQRCRPPPHLSRNSSLYRKWKDRNIFLPDAALRPPQLPDTCSRPC